ncbi:hypothetical protein AGMMS49949_03030 [Alphaproteobacteria bacterium]|nr:hypothetical protein AGMMS49949_03030 [Alphaproteobacteria bacterium]GHS95821.1 hypothetical protein AGMMS50296_1050 [Alphaproteobacteria bacterium]
MNHMIYIEEIMNNKKLLNKILLFVLCLPAPQVNANNPNMRNQTRANPPQPASPQGNSREQNTLYVRPPMDLYSMGQLPMNPYMEPLMDPYSLGQLPMNPPYILQPPMIFPYMGPPMDPYSIGLLQNFMELLQRDPYTEWPQVDSPYLRKQSQNYVPQKRGQPVHSQNFKSQHVPPYVEPQPNYGPQPQLPYLNQPQNYSPQQNFSYGGGQQNYGQPQAWGPQIQKQSSVQAQNQVLGGQEKIVVAGKEMSFEEAKKIFLEAIKSKKPLPDIPVSQQTIGIYFAEDPSTGRIPAHLAVQYKNVEGLCKILDKYKEFEWKNLIKVSFFLGSKSHTYASGQKEARLTDKNWQSVLETLASFKPNELSLPEARAMLEALKDYCSDTGLTLSGREPAFEMAIKNNNIQCAKLFIDVFGTDFLVAEQSDGNIIQRLFDADLKNANSTSKPGKEDLLFKRLLEVIEDSKAEINFVFPDRETFLAKALRSGNMPCIRFLVEKGINFETDEEKGELLHLLATAGPIKIAVPEQTQQKATPSRPVPQRQSTRETEKMRVPQESKNTFYKEVFNIIGGNAVSDLAHRRNEEGLIPLFHAFKNNNVDLAISLIEFTDLQETDAEGNNILHVLIDASRENKGMFSTIMSHIKPGLVKELACQENNNCITPLEQSFWSGKNFLDLVAIVGESCLNVEFKDGNSILHAFASDDKYLSQFRDFVKILEEQAKLRHISSKGAVSLKPVNATRNRNLNIPPQMDVSQQDDFSEIIFENLAKTNSKDESAFDIAYERAPRMFREFSNYGVPAALAARFIVEKRSSEVEKGLNISLDKRKKNILGFKTEEGETLLHIAAFKGEWKTFDLLMKYGADLFTADIAERLIEEQKFSVLEKAFHVLSDQQKKDILEYKTEEDDTLLHLAALRGDGKLFTLLMENAFLINNGVPLFARNSKDEFPIQSFVFKEIFSKTDTTCSTTTKMNIRKVAEAMNDRERNASQDLTKNSWRLNPNRDGVPLYLELLHKKGMLPILEVVLPDKLSPAQRQQALKIAEETGDKAVIKYLENLR